MKLCLFLFFSKLNIYIFFNNFFDLIFILFKILRTISQVCDRWKIGEYLYTLFSFASSLTMIFGSNQVATTYLSSVVLTFSLDVKCENAQTVSYLQIGSSCSFVQVFSEG